MHSLCFQAKRMFPAVLPTTRGSASWTDFEAEIGLPPSIDDFDDTPEGQAEHAKAMEGIDEASPRHKHIVSSMPSESKRVNGKFTDWKPVHRFNLLGHDVNL
ncbi:MAG: hypothetical protein Ct9H90mP16_09480 [Candidatus Poseidoniales archaeon]|nr:MAG: hypothetical protein Ct9H90mP16_09480 [Candidatus Poseidoniales archaeon]